jgi:predicted kinase
MPLLNKQIVLISGPPGAGKTTLAVPLAERLDFPLLSKDHIKETLFEALPGPVGDLEYSRRIGSAAMFLLWELAGACPRVVLEANFRPYSDLERGRILGLEARLVEVYCQCPAEEAARRYTARAAAGDRHPAHARSEISAPQMAEFDRPFGLGEVIRVDTTRPVDLDWLAGKVRALLNGNEKTPE